jgi:hypothetical protein
MPNMVHRYRMGPFELVSELALPELPQGSAGPEQPSEGASVSIRIGTPPDEVDRTPFHISSPVYDANEREFLLRVEGIGRFYARDGCEVLLEPSPGAPELDIRTYLLASIFAALCHQRGFLPLHASAVATRAGVVAFAGPSGAGKSSLAAHLHRRGYRVVADDICLIDPGGPVERRVIPVAPWLKLWQETLEELQEAPAAHPRAISSEDKYRMLLSPGDCAPLRLAEILLLSSGSEGSGEVSDGSGVRFAALAPARALDAVLASTFQAYVVRATGQTAAYFQRWGRALEGVRVTEMVRPWGFGRMRETLDALENRWAGRLASD